MGAIDRFFSSGTPVPKMPEFARRLIQSFDGEKIDLRQIVDLAEHDQPLSASIIRQANSARYGVGGVDNLSQAAVLLGRETLRNLLLSASVIGVFPSAPGFDRVRFWRHCVATGGYSRWLGRRLGFDSDTAYLAGFLLRAGQILMAIELPHMVAAIEAECVRPGLRMSIERQKVGCCHPHITGELARRWGLPEPMVDAFRHAPDPLNAKPFSLLAAVLSLSATAADAGDLGLSAPEALIQADPALLTHLRLEADWIADNLPSYESMTYTVDALCPPRTKDRRSAE
jgi:HD-like signal output (HDOD) protein